MNTHYRHFRESILQKNHTFCGVVNKSGNLMIGLAVANPKDMFVKEIGRDVAYKSAHFKPIAVLVIHRGEYSCHVFHEFVNNMYPAATFKRRVHVGATIEFA